MSYLPEDASFTSIHKRRHEPSEYVVDSERDRVRQDMILSYRERVADYGDRIERIWIILS